MKKLLGTLLLTMQVGAIVAQGTVADYKRAYSLRQKFSSANVYGSASDVRWNGSNEFIYSVNTPDLGQNYMLWNSQSNWQMKALNKQSVISQLAAATGKSLDAKNFWFRGMQKTQDGVKFEYDGYNWEVKDAFTANAKLEKKDAVWQDNRPQRHWMEVDDEKGNGPVASPDGKYEAFIKNDNIYVREKATGKERALSNDGTKANYYSSWIVWSPDSKKVAACRIRPVTDKRYVYYVESSPSDQLQPKLHKQEYPKPGDELRFKVPCIYNVETGKATIPSTDLFNKQYDIYGPEWSKDSKTITFEYNERGHKIYRVLELNAETDKVRTLIEEKSNTFVNYSRHYRYDTNDGKSIIWLSERDNWAHLYLVDKATGKVKNQITKGNWCVRSVVAINDEKKLIYFTASGMNKNEDPYLIHYYKIGWDGKKLTSLTPEEGNHDAKFSEDFNYIVDTYSMVNKEPVTVLRDGEGKIVKEITHADISKIKANGWTAPEVFVAPGRDGVTPMWGIIQRPTNFDSNKKYPVIEYIYSGPGDAYTPKSFISYNWNMSSLAELGFIVVQLDAMGTSYRGKKFEDVCYKNLKDAGFPDREAWIKAAAQKYPYMDANNVGIFGASAGGQESTTAVLLHGDFYKAAYSSCGCHDNRMDKIWWNEQWMGYPIDSSYVECSNVANAYKLERPLMLVVGEMDDNVDPASTMQVVDALIKANKDFELVVLPGVHHTMGGDFGEHKRYDFFVKNLLKKCPPTWQEVKE